MCVFYLRDLKQSTGLGHMVYILIYFLIELFQDFWDTFE